MPGEADDRSVRAEAYVRGELSAGERQRAERDLEIDARFRDAVVASAERLNVIQLPPDPAASRWKEVAERLAVLPQMRPPPERAAPALPEEPPVRFGRRRSDRKSARPLARSRPIPVRLLVPVRVWLVVVAASALLVAFGLGYLTGNGVLSRLF